MVSTVDGSSQTNWEEVFSRNRYELGYAAVSYGSTNIEIPQEPTDRIAAMRAKRKAELDRARKALRKGKREWSEKG
jgi:hypothetical protein